MVQFALTANIVVCFLCFLASVMLIGSTIQGCIAARTREVESSVSDGESAGQVEVLQVLAEK